MRTVLTFIVLMIAFVACSVPSSVSPTVSMATVSPTRIPTLVSLPTFTPAPAKNPVSEQEASIFKDIMPLVPGTVYRLEYKCEEQPIHDIMWTGKVDIRIYNEDVKYSIEMEIDGIKKKVEDEGTIQVTMCGRNVIVGFIEINGGIQPIHANPKLYIYNIARSVEP